MSGKRKPDYSNYLAHFTRDSVCVNNGNCLDEDYILMSALEKLISILKTKTIFKSTMPWTNSEAVCFTECPWSSFIEHSKNYSSYGIGFTKKFIFGKHGSPAIYMRVDTFINEKVNNFANIPDAVKYLITPFQPIYTPSRMKRLRFLPVDYTHEREWRSPNDILFDYKDVKFIVLKSNEDYISFPHDLRQLIGDEKFLILDNYKSIEQLWPIHIL